MKMLEWIKSLNEDLPMHPIEEPKKCRGNCVLCPYLTKDEDCLVIDGMIDRSKYYK